MPTKPQSWKKVREVRREKNFVGRADQLKVFADKFTSDVPRYMVIAVTGEGGVGKSTLLLQYEATARANASETIVITCDERHPSPVTAMGYIAAELEKHGFVRKDFGDRYKKYHELRQELEGDAKVPRPLVNLLARGVTDLAIKSMRKVPGAGVFFEYADEREAGEAFAQLINYGIDRWGNKDEVKLLREPEVDLTPLFLGLLGDASATRRVVLMFDVFERTADTLAPWLLGLFRFEYGEFNTNVTFVISGRNALEQHWTELAGDLCRVSLEPFTLDETRQYLGNQGITDELVTAQIHGDSGGLPVLVELLAATNPQPGIPLADISQDAVKRFLQWTPQEDRRRAALLAAVPRQFNKDILSAALGQEVGGLYNWLMAQSYIRTSTERGSFYHEKVRELMLRHLRNTTPADLASTHHRLAEFYASAQVQLGFAGKAAYDSETWGRLELERVYHSVSEQPERDMVVVIDAFFHAFPWRLDLAEGIVEVCRQFRQEIQIPATRGLAPTLSAILNTNGQRNREALLRALETLDTIPNLTSETRCKICALRGRTYGQMGQYEQAVAYLDRAISLDGTLVWAIVLRGSTYVQLENYERALEDLDRAIALDKNGAQAIAARGVTHMLMAQFDLALADLNRAIDLGVQDATTIAFRGELHLKMGRYEEALADLDWAIALDSGQMGAISNRALAHLLMGRYQEALTDLDSAIAQDTNNAWAFAARGIVYWLILDLQQALSDFNRTVALDSTSPWAFAFRGDVYLQMGQYAQALVDFERVIALDEKFAWAIANRGVTYQQMGQYAQALADFDRAIALDEKDASTIARRGETYRRMGQYAQALADFDRAIALDQKDASTIARRGETYRRMGEYAQALADFDRAIALDEKDAWAIASRGQTYRALERYDEAIADLSLAVEIDPTVEWAVQERGETYRQMGQYEQALADFDRAIALDEKYAWAIGSRGETYRQMGQYEQALADFDRAIAIESSDWYLYGRALVYRLLGQQEKAVADLGTAIAEARADEAKSPDDWQNRLNLALYYVANGDPMAAASLYQAAIDARVTETLARDAAQDLDDYLHLFPDDETARPMRARLQQAIDTQRTGND